MHSAEAQSTRQNRGAVGYSEQALLDTARDLCPVVQHSVNWYPHSWFEAVADLQDAARITDSLASLRGDAESLRIPITRQQVVARFAESSLDGYIATIVWGCGTDARNRARMLRVFRESDDILARIDALVLSLNGATPGEAWDAITVTRRLKWLGPAFGTKVAYFAGLASSPSSGPWPLIADATVAAALGAPVNHNRAVYVGYCERAWLLRDQLKGPRRRPDQVEYALFKLGQGARSA